MNKRVFYQPHKVWVNGGLISNISNLSMKVDMNLAQCFCGCPLPLPSMVEQYRGKIWCDWLHRDIWIHNEDCPNANKEMFIRYITKEEIKEYRKSNEKR